MYFSHFPFRTLLIRSARLLSEKINLALQEFDLTYSQWIVMHVIHDAEKCSLIDIAKVLNISQPAVTKRIFELEQKGFVQFIPTTDRREKIVALNEAGLDVYLKGHDFLDAFEQRYCDGISDENFEQLKTSLRIFMNNLEDERT